MAGREILIVDEDAPEREELASALRGRGFDVVEESSASQALERLSSEGIGAVVTDLNIGRLGGTGGLYERLLEVRPDIPVIVVAAFGSLEAAVSAIQSGAYDFIPKPVEVETLVTVLDRALRQRALREEVRGLRSNATETAGHEGMVGESAAMLELYSMIERVSESDSTVLITGETGTGKEVVARALHKHSRRRGGSFVAVNCAAVPEPLLESELFGHARGAFTDARDRRTGLLLEASGGTLFLDEIGDMPLRLQAKLLRALQERTVRPVGTETEIAFDARVIAATNRDLEAAVARGRFRQDLYYRISVIVLPVPPLRERARDVLLLAQYFIELFGTRSRKPVTSLTSAAADRLLEYSWPGNVRELKNCIERAVALAAHDRIRVADLPPNVRRRQTTWAGGSDPSALPPLEEVERQYIERVLQAVGGKKTVAARVLGVDRKTLYRKLEAYRAASAEPELTETHLPHDR